MMLKKRDSRLSYFDGLSEWRRRYDDIKDSIFMQKRDGASSRHISLNGATYKNLLCVNGDIGLVFIFENFNNTYERKSLYFTGIFLEGYYNDNNYEVRIVINKNYGDENFIVSVLYNCFTYIDSLNISAEDKIKEIWSYILGISDLFKEYKEKTISISQEKGLIGELQTIKFLYVEAKIDINRIIEFWVGPNKEKFDFNFKKYSIESKIMSKNNQVEFHGINQTVVNKDTYLHSIKIEEGNGESLDELVLYLRSKLQFKERQLFDTLLNKDGYYIGIETSKKKYEITESYFINMNKKEFPKYHFDNGYSDLTSVKLNINELDKSLFIGKNDFIQLLSKH